MKKFGRFFGQSPKNNDICLRRAKALRSEFCCLPVLICLPVFLLCLPVIPRKGANGGKREGERSERESVVPRQNKDSRRDGGHAPPQRHLKRSAATTKVGFTGEKTTERASCEVRLLSSRLNLSSCLNFVPTLPERVARGDNRICLLSPR